MSGIKLLFFFFIILVIPFSLKSQVKWSFEFCGGVPYNLPATIKVHQSGYADLKISNAHFYTEPFALPPYWDWRFTRIKNNHIIELEAIHHKLYLSNKPPEIKRFSISHGFNLFFLNYGILGDALKNEKVYKGKIIARFGLGGVFAHPETEIRNYAFEDKGEFLSTTYYLCGPAINLTLGKRWYLLRRLFINTEVKATAAYVKIPIALGHAKIFTSSLQFVAGLGFDFISK